MTGIGSLLVIHRLGTEWGSELYSETLKAALPPRG